MPPPFTEEQQKRHQSFLEMQLKKHEITLPHKDQISLLEKKKRRQSWFMGLNIVAILFFGYSFWSGITQLGNTILYILVIVFVINICLGLYQSKRLKELIAYLNWRKDAC